MSNEFERIWEEIQARYRNFSCGAEEIHENPKVTRTVLRTEI